MKVNVENKNHFSHSKFIASLKSIHLAEASVEDVID